MLIPKVSLRNLLSSSNSNNTLDNDSKSSSTSPNGHSTKKRDSEHAHSPKDVYDKEECVHRLWVELLKFLFSEESNHEYSGGSLCLLSSKSAKKKKSSTNILKQNSSSVKESRRTKNGSSGNWITLTHSNGSATNGRESPTSFLTSSTQSPTPSSKSGKSKKRASISKSITSIPESPTETESSPTALKSVMKDSNTSISTSKRNSTTTIDRNSEDSLCSSFDNVNINQNGSLVEIKRRIWECLFWSAGIEGVDTLLRRFIVARKGKVQDALKMVVNALEWRVDYDVMGLCRKGERIIDATEFSSGKVYFYNFDKEGRIVTYIHVCKHIKDAKPQIETEKMTILSMETIRLLLNKKNPTACIVFNMSGFSMQNMDYGFIRFLLSCFQNYYPEMLGIALIVGAPLIFYGCWNIVKQLLDPVVANKVQFIKDINEIKNYIDEENMPTCFGGTSGYDFNYIPYNEEDDVPLEDSKETLEAINKWNMAKNKYIMEIYNEYKDKLPSDVNINNMLFPVDETSISLENSNHDINNDNVSENSNTNNTNNNNNNDSNENNSNINDNDKNSTKSNNSEDDSQVVNDDNNLTKRIKRKTEQQLFETFVAVDKLTRSRTLYHRSGFTHY